MRPAYDALMQAALAEARSALSTGDVPIGALVIDTNGEVIGHGRNVRERDHDLSSRLSVREREPVAASFGARKHQDRIDRPRQRHVNDRGLLHVVQTPIHRFPNPVRRLLPALHPGAYSGGPGHTKR